MSDQKSEETKSPLARRGARPFVGPAGASSGTRPPLFKPATPPTRVATPALPLRPALGARVQLAAPERPATPAPVVPATPEPAFSVEQPTQEAVAATPELIAAPEQAPVEPAGVDHWSVAATPAYTPTLQSVIDQVPPADDVMSSLSESEPGHDTASFERGDEQASVEPPHLEAVDAPEEPVTRPITSEMVAIDAFEAFETVWEPTAEPELEAAAEPDSGPVEAFQSPTTDEPVPTSPLDGESLGSGVDAQQLWGDEITQGTGDYPASEAASEATSSDAPEGAALEAGRASRTTPELPMPAWLADDAPSAAVRTFEERDSAPEPKPEDLPPAPHEATASSIVGSVPNGSAWNDSRMAAYAAFVTSPDGVPAISNAIANDKNLRGLQVSAALERLAERIRDGEIDVSSVAPEAPDAAMLASVLAALLGGSKSR